MATIWEWDELGHEWNEAADSWEEYAALNADTGWLEFRPAEDVRTYRSSRGHYAIAVEAASIDAAHGRACDFDGYLQAVHDPMA